MESFSGMLRDELLNGEIFDTVTEARVVIEQWRREYNQQRDLTALWDTDHRHLKLFFLARLTN